jgi:hypothetical protein
MFTHPGITADLAAQHRRELTAQARACRLARSDRQGGTGRFPAARRVVAALAVASAAAAILVTSPVDNSHARLHDAFRYRAQHVSAFRYRAQTDE